MKKWTAPCCMVMSVVVALANANAVEIYKQVNMNPVWRFRLGELSGEPYSVDYDDKDWDIVSLPHSEQIFSANLSGFNESGRASGWYRRELQVPPNWLSKKAFLEFRGAMQTTAVWVNGVKAGDYAVSGFDSFDFDITPFVKAGKNVIAVKVDNRVNRAIPPDGQPMDYILFGGLYRDVFLHVTDPMHLTFPWEARQAGVRLTTPEVSEKQAVVQAESTVRNESSGTRKCSLLTEIRDHEGKVVATLRDEREIPSGKEGTFVQMSQPIANPHLWSPDDPYLYKVVTMVMENGQEVDRTETSLGIRWVKFDKEKGFFLNGKHLKLVGANCHQTWPFIGGAVPDGLHRRDAEQLKAMGVNWVRLSHYPQDPSFLDALDELGLMALEEPPTWITPGDAQWMANLETSLRSMIRRDRNHPSIVIWGACLNHQKADPRLARAALEEDSTRERGQDTVPLTMNFTRGQISGGGVLSIEHTGHTFPAQRGARSRTYRIPGKRQDRIGFDINREYEQAQRHWEQVNAAYQREDNAGLAVWCMYDYNTFHNVNEPGMVWHGVCDMFRIPKFSYWWHMSELTSKPMAFVVRVDETNAAVFSNCEQIRLWQDQGEGYQEVATRKPDTSFVGANQQEVTFVLHHPPFSFVVASNATAIRAEGLIGGEVKTAFEWKKFGAPVALTLGADRPSITADGADLSRIIVTAVDTNGTPVDTCNSRVTFAIEGLGQLIGENPVKLRAGKMIILAQSGFVPGEIVVSARAIGLSPAQVTVKTLPVAADVDMPQELPSKQPTKRDVVVAPVVQRTSN